MHSVICIWNINFNKKMNVKDRIVNKLFKKNKYLRVDKFINECLHEKNSYYKINNPIGKNHDFITAPEISQMFGEIIGLYIIDYWIKKIKSHFNLIELGPGNGTLLKDIIRVSKINPNFLNYSNITLIDKNYNLIKIQKEALNSLKINKIKWAKEFSLSSTLPSIIYSNEFFDCFSIRQFYKKKHWLEKYVSYHSSENRFSFIDKKIINIKLLKKLEKFERNGVAEISKERGEVFNKLCKHISNNKGIIITIDYGYDKSLNNFSLQSIFKHKKTHLFDNIGKQDITSLVNFDELKGIAKLNNLKIDIYCSQKDFLISNGINDRKKILKKNSPLQKQKKIEEEYKRLVGEKQMGNFKVLVVSSK